MPITANAAVYTFDCDASDTTGAVAAYDASGRLTAVRLTSLKCESGKLVSDDMDITGSTVKLYLFGSDTAVRGTILQPQATPVADTDLYPEEHIALYAPALVKKVQTAYIDGEDVYTLTLLYQGEEIEFSATSELLIASSSTAYEDSVGQDASALKVGDVIILNYVFKDYPKSICLLYRPSKTEPISNEEMSDFLPLYTNEDLWNTNLKDDISHHFGVVTDLTKNVVTICDKDGSAKEIPFNKNAAVYLYDIQDKSKTEIVGASGIEESYIDSDAADDYGNITDWAKTSDRVYALIRAIDGIATDIVIYRY